MDADLKGFFVGSFEHKLDAKGRVSLPSDFREALRAQGSANEFVAIPSFEGKQCLQAMSRKGHNNLLLYLKQLEFDDPEEEELTRHCYIGRATTISVEETGRFVLGKDLRNAIRLDAPGEVTFHGDASSFEIWLKSDFDERYAQPKKKPRLIRLGKI